MIMESFLISVITTSVISLLIFKTTSNNTYLKNNLDKLKDIKENVNKIENRCGIYDRIIDNLNRCIESKGISNGK